MKVASRFTVRPAVEADLDFILSLLPRFAEAAPDWRTPQQIVDRISQDIRDSFDEGEDFVAIAETAQQEPAGFIRLAVKSDFVTNEPFGYVEELVVSPQVEGQGVARLLMDTAQAWARSQGFTMLALHMLAGNERARRLYERLGYQPEVVKYVKLLGGDDCG